MHARSSRVINFRVRPKALVDGLRQWCPMAEMPLRSPNAGRWPRAQPPGEARTWPFQKGHGAQLKTRIAVENRCGRYRWAEAVRCFCLLRTLASVADIGRYLERDTPAVGPGLQSPLLRDNGRDHVIMGVTMGVIPVYDRT